MEELRIYLQDDISEAVRKTAAHRFGYHRGALSRSLEEAAIQWLMREDAINTILSEMVKTAEKDQNVVAIVLFGSYALNDPKYRDVDVAIILREAARSFDYINKYSPLRDDRLFDVSIFNDLPLHIKVDILNKGIILYCQDKSKLFDIASEVIRQWRDGEHLHRLQLHA